MSYESFGGHIYLTHTATISREPVIMIKCAECDWVRGAPGEPFDDIWGAHIDNAKATDRTIMAGLRNKLLAMRNRVTS